MAVKSECLKFIGKVYSGWSIDLLDTSGKTKWTYYYNLICCSVFVPKAAEDMTIIMLTLANICMVIIVTGFYDGIWMVTENVIDAFINIINNHNINICVVLKKGLILTIPHFTIPSYDKLLTVHFVCWITLVVKSILGLYIKQDTRKVLTE